MRRSPGAWAAREDDSRRSDHQALEAPRPARPLDLLPGDRLRKTVERDRSGRGDMHDSL